MYRLCSGRVFLLEKDAEAHVRKIGRGRVVKSGNYIVVLQESKDRRKLDFALESYRKEKQDVFVAIER
jgi:DNA-binding sugar fermentation-stimulating protein